MPELEDLVTPDSFLSLEDARAYLDKESSTHDWPISAAINIATSILELRTRRQLKERIYVTPASIACSTVVNTKPVTGTGFMARRVGEDILGTDIRMGTRIESIASGTSLTMTIAAAGTGTPTLTFGRGAALAWHIGGRDVLLPERPVETVYGMNVVESDGTKTAVDLTNAMLDREAGILTITQDSIRRNAPLEIEMKAGYRKPSNTDIGHPRDWYKLEHLTRRVVEILFQEHRHQLGRALEMTNIREQAIRFISLKLPDDVLEDLKLFEREHV